MDTYEKLLHCVDCVKERTDFVPEIAIVLGSGLNYFADNIEARCIIPYGDIDGFPVSTVAGHEGRLILGMLCGKKVACLQGRVHYYEGYSMEDVVLPTRLVGMLGAETILLTGAAGAINASYTPGTLLILNGLIASFMPSPLRGKNLDKLGPRFPDMSEPFDPALRALMESEAEKLGIKTEQGVYIQTRGPQYETPQEINFYRRMGADAVGMSTGCEVIAARHMGLRVGAISCLTNFAAGILNQPLSHEEVQAAAKAVSENFSNLLSAVVGAI